MNFQPDAEGVKLSENIIIADADYVDRVAFNLTVNFERMLGRRIPKANLPLWMVCVALDGGLREGNHQVQVLLVHEKGSEGMENFAPGSFAEVDGKAFRDPQLGEFTVQALAVEDFMTKETLMHDLVETTVGHGEVKRLVVIPDSEEGEAWQRCANALRSASDDLRATFLAMQPKAGGNFRQEILGYSLMKALGIRGDELK